MSSVKRGAIRLGDPTSHGGLVKSAAPKSWVKGVAVARKGDLCSCSIPGHDNCLIAEGDPMIMICSIPVGFDGHKRTCGAVLISTTPSSGSV